MYWRSLSVAEKKKSLRSSLHPFLFQESSQGALSLTNISWALCGVGVGGCLWSRIEWWALGSYQFEVFLHLLLTTHPGGCFTHHPVARKAVLLNSLCFLLSDKSCGPWLSESTALKRKLKYGHHLIHKPGYFFSVVLRGPIFHPQSFYKDLLAALCLSDIAVK